MIQQLTQFKEKKPVTKEKVRENKARGLFFSNLIRFPTNCDVGFEKLHS